jgi:phosphoglycerate dehydrogenase-like enzyme
VAKRALAFDLRVRALRRRKLWSPVPGVELAASLPELVADADHLVLAVPATGATRHIVDAPLLARVKPGLHLVNVARGSLVDQDALRAALDDGRVARASLDVCDPEPLPAGHWLYTHPKVHLSPHVSWAGPGAFEALLDSFIANVDLWQRGLPLEGVVDLEAGY